MALTVIDSFRLRRLMFFRTPEALKTLRDEAEARLAAIEAGTVAIAQLVFGAPTELTISAGGSVTTTRISHKIDTAADGASDDLDTLVGVGDGEFILLRPESAARDVVIRDTGGGTGNIRTPHAQSITLAELTDWAFGIGDGTNVTILAFRTAAGNGGGAGALIGLLASLTTTVKTSVVAAINEIQAPVGRMLVDRIAATAARLVLHEATDNGVHKTTFAAPASLAADRTVTIPDADVDLGLIATALQIATIQQARAAMVGGSVTFAGMNLTAASVIVPIKEIEDPAASGALTIGAITPGTPGSVTITSANGAETSTIRAVVLN